MAQPASKPNSPPAGALRPASPAWIRRLGRTVRRWSRRLRPGRRRGPRVRTALCREGFYYLLVLVFVFAAAMIADMNLLMVLAGMMLGPLWFSRRLVSTTLRGLEVRRRLPHGVCAGDLLVVQVELSNTRPRIGSWAVVVEEHIHQESGGGGPPPLRPNVFFPYVPSGDKRSRVYRGRLPQRGRYRFGPLRISTRFPFGFFRRVVTLDRAETLTVYPRLGRLTQQWLHRRHAAFEGADRRERLAGGVSGDFYGVRPWRSGDSRRLVHWRSSARRGSLVVRQFEQQRNRDLAVLLDLWRPESPELEHMENVELAVSFAATVIAELCRKGGSDLILGTAGRPGDCLRGPASAALLHDAMEELAIAEAGPGDGLAGLLERMMPNIDRGTEVVLISTRPVDLGDAARFGVLLADPGRRAMLAQVRVINTADAAALAAYFEPA